WRTTRTY
ncbi:cysteine protease, YopT-type domain protein, partial [Chlamydia psittaci C1/97]